jgi:hypothetical protein
MTLQARRGGGGTQQPHISGIAGLLSIFTPRAATRWSSHRERLLMTLLRH